MTAFTDTFHDPRWHAKRDALLEAAEHQCENCHRTDDLFVHISGFEPGVEPWEYPDEAYRCLCRTHHDHRAKAERDAKRFLRFLDEDALDSICDTLSYLADLPEPRRGVAAEELYVTAKHGPRVDEHDE